MTSSAVSNTSGSGSGQHTAPKANQADRRIILDRREAAGTKKADSGHEAGTKKPVQPKNETTHRAY
ncbi:hypothetical protein RQP54_17040 [Curvibacter sp. APW13]|uniref:hypothetical protein n=1 Tax=Curvibacter sp. APW13 TaxID=3077236 RepID=UPI0028DD64C8|nr:hypothetical protein [Curvibacter sp. APW13]MDT8992580.1 hypothetical protein [Curvibacter sp. APW13]